MDKYDAKTRSMMMAAVRSRGNMSTELRMVKLLRAGGLSGWRRHLRIPGTPDFCWPAARVALFVDGCFWHGCPRCRRAPKSREVFWDKKVRENMRRDRRVDRALRGLGWRVVRVWECRIGDAGTLSRLARILSMSVGAGTVLSRPRPNCSATQLGNQPAPNLRTSKALAPEMPLPLLPRQARRMPKQVLAGLHRQNRRR